MISFTVYGTPVAKGSTKAFVVKGRAVTTTNNPKTKDWQGLIATVAQGCRPENLYDGAVSVMLEFYFTRPKSVKKHKRPYPSVKPDIDKLTRASLDGLTGIVITDDARITDIKAVKRYDDSPRVEITVKEVWHGKGEKRA